MKIKKLSISSEFEDIELPLNSPVCIIRGNESAYYLDIIRELIGNNPFCTPDIIDDGRFFIYADVELDSKDYEVCYLRNTDYVGDCQITANFDCNGDEVTRDDTKEYLSKINERNADYRNVFELISIESDQDIRGESDRILAGLDYFIESCKTYDDKRPVFIYDFVERIDMSIDLKPYIDKLASIRRQVFIATTKSYHMKQFENATLLDV